MTDTADDDESLKTLGKGGAISAVLGLCALIQLTLEGLQANPVSLRYLLTLALESVHAIAAIVVGFALRSRKDWSFSFATLLSASGFVHAAVTLIELGPGPWKTAFVLQFSEEMFLWAAVGSRLLITAVQAMFWPILLGLVYLELYYRSAPQPIRKGAYWMCISAAALVCGAVELLLRKVPDLNTWTWR